MRHAGRARADAPALREVLGDRATFVDAGDMAALIGGGRGRRAPGPAAAALELGGRRARDLAGLRERAAAEAAGSAPARAAPAGPPAAPGLGTPRGAAGPAQAGSSSQ